MPPSIVLEVLRILEAEVYLREETRVAQQAREAVDEDVHTQTAAHLTQVQQDLADRTRDVIDRILELPDAEIQFGRDLRLLRQVAVVMDEARDLLATKETGNPTIAAETEAIELLLQSKRINPSGGGGGGANPGGGGGGTTADSALALLGSSNNSREVREETGLGQTTGTTGSKVPAEWRQGIDEYFHRLEAKRTNTP